MMQEFCSIDLWLKSLQRFGVHLGLESILNLLADLGNPHQSIPIIHVGGTNGKGSVCAYLSSILAEAGYKVGRYTSPHLIDWTERICINNQPIVDIQLETILIKIKNIIESYAESPTQFEVITAAAWVYFAQENVDIAVIEVGLGGRLDATNVCDNPLVSIITSISREHWQYLGDTLGEIATEKAGILKQNCSTVIAQVPDEAKIVFNKRIEELTCSSVWVKPAIQVQDNWATYQDIEYPLPLSGKVQLSNSALAIATVKILQKKGWNISLSAIQKGMTKTQWLGRLQWIKWRGYSILVDGAHNREAAEMLRDYVDTLDKPITWIIGILEAKEYDKILEKLLKPQDKLYLVPVPNYNSVDPELLAKIAINICPKLTQIKIVHDVFLGLEAASQNNTEERLIILCGSLYLVGYVLKNLSITDSSY